MGRKSEPPPPPHATPKQGEIPHDRPNELHEVNKLLPRAETCSITKSAGVSNIIQQQSKH